MPGGRPKAPDSFFVAENYRSVSAKFRLHVHLLGWNLFYFCSCSGFCSRMNTVDTCSSRRQNAHTPHSKTDWGFITNGLFLWIMFTESTNPNAETETTWKLERRYFPLLSSFLFVSTVAIPLSPSLPSGNPTALVTRTTLSCPQLLWATFSFTSYSSYSKYTSFFQLR